jgi:hypothetical protein
VAANRTSIILALYWGTFQLLPLTLNVFYSSVTLESYFANRHEQRYSIIPLFLSVRVWNNVVYVISISSSGLFPVYTRLHGRADRRTVVLFRPRLLLGCWRIVVPGSKDGGSDSYVGGARRNGLHEIPGHAHTQLQIVRVPFQSDGYLSTQVDEYIKAR